jgi:DNA primase
MIYNKSRLLFGLNSAQEAIKELDGVVIMEGYFDVISAQAHGVKNAVASCGTALTPEHVKLISRYTKSRRIYLSFDTDNAGVNATKKGSSVIKETLSALGNVKQFDESHISSGDDNKYACEIRVVSPPQGKDPDEFIRTAGGEAFTEYIKNAPLLIDFLLNNTLKNRASAKTPQEKAELVAQIIDILKDVNNKIIQTEYVKMVASIINVDENALLKELSNIDRLSSRQEITPQVVTKSSQFEIKAQKNLLSVFLTSDSPLSYQKLNEMLPENIIQDETLIIVKNTIDKLAQTINNVRELIKGLYTEFIEDDNLTQILTDIVELSEAFYGLEAPEFELAVRENISRLERIYKDKESKKIREQYKKANDDEIEALKIQMQLRDKLKLRTGDK